MNANELADELEDDYWDSRAKKVMLESAKMLRQQQAEIEALKKEAALQRLSDFTQEADNEPVAWMLTLPDGTHDWILDGNGCEGYIPLYTHPAKTLTDEEIKTIYYETGDLFDFARAILRKAQEK